jgi:hypothetical protein
MNVRIDIQLLVLARDSGAGISVEFERFPGRLCGGGSEVGGGGSGRPEEGAIVSLRLCLCVIADWLGKRGRACRAVEDTNGDEVALWKVDVLLCEERGGRLRTGAGGEDERRGGGGRLERGLERLAIGEGGGGGCARDRGTVVGRAVDHDGGRCGRERDGGGPALLVVV